MPDRLFVISLFAQAQFTQFLQTAETAGFSLQDIRIFGCHKING